MNNLKLCKVLVTPTSFGKGDPELKTALESAVGLVVYNPTRRPLTSAELKELLPGCDGFIAGLDAIDRAALEGADRLQVIARYGVGVDNVDLDAAAEKGIIVTNTPGANSGSVAELAVALMLALGRNLVEAATAARAGGWPRLQGTSLEGRCVGLLGFGAIGRQVARRLAGFGCRVLAYDPFPDTAAAAESGVELASFNQVLAQADFLSLHLPVLPETRRLVNAAFLAQMKDGACLVNTARGELIDEAALVDAIRSGKLRGAALDVFPVEPPAPDNPLLQLPQVLVTPHISSHTDIATRNMGSLALAECLAVLRGETPCYRVK